MNTDGVSPNTLRNSQPIVRLNNAQRRQDIPTNTSQVLGSTSPPASPTQLEGLRPSLRITAQPTSLRSAPGPTQGSVQGLAPGPAPGPTQRSAEPAAINTIAEAGPAQGSAQVQVQMTTALAESETVNIQNNQRDYALGLDTEKEKLQFAVDNFDRDPDSAILQNRLSEAAVAFAGSKTTCADWLAGFHAMIQPSASSMLGYGGRNFVNSALDQAMNAPNGTVYALGAAAVESLSNPFAIVSGQVLTQTVLTPEVFNILPYHQEPIPTRGILPDSIRKDMNDLLPPNGEIPAGDYLGTQIDEKKKKLASPQEYLRTAQLAYGITATLNALAKVSGNPGAKWAVAAAAPAVAGASLGTSMAIFKASTQFEVPTQEGLNELRTLLQTRRTAAEIEADTIPKATPNDVAGLPKNNSSLYYPRKVDTIDFANKRIAAANLRPTTWVGSAESFLMRSWNTTLAILPANTLGPAAAIYAKLRGEPSGGAPGAGVGIAASMSALQANTASQPAYDAGIRARNNDQPVPRMPRPDPSQVPNHYLAPGDPTNLV